MQFFSSRMLPGQGYFCNETAARLLKPRMGLRCFSEKCLIKNSANGSMSSPHSERGGTLMVNSFRRWNRSSRKRPSDIALSRFSFVAATRRTSKAYSRVDQRACSVFPVGHATGASVSRGKGCRSHPRTAYPYQPSGTVRTCHRRLR